MYRDDDLQADELEQRAEQLVGLQDEMSKVADDVGADPEEAAGERDEKEARVRLGYEAGETAAPETVAEGAASAADVAAAGGSYADDDREAGEET
jgi:hypothetical protein